MKLGDGCMYAGISLGMYPANERCRYNVTTSPIGFAHTLTDPYICVGVLGRH